MLILATVLQETRKWLLETARSVAESTKCRRHPEVSERVQSVGDSPKCRRQPKVSKTVQNDGDNPKCRRRSEISETLQLRAAFNFLNQAEAMLHGASGNIVRHAARDNGACNMLQVVTSM
jgi:hypothetical protein